MIEKKAVLTRGKMIEKQATLDYKKDLNNLDDKKAFFIVIKITVF